MKQLFEFRNVFIPQIDEWKDTYEFFQFNDKYLYCSYIQEVFNLPDDSLLPYFNLSNKKSYNNMDIKCNFSKYFNYFLTFFDTQHELLDAYIKIKFKIDLKGSYYPLDEFYDDLFNILLTPTMLQKLAYMNQHNIFEVKSKKSYMHEGLVYQDHHVNLLYNISLIMKISIPLLVHYSFVKTDIVLNMTEFLLNYYNKVFNIFDINIKRKMTATVDNVVNSSLKTDLPMWNKANIRGINPSIHTLENLNDLISCVLPKLEYKNPGHILIYKSARNNLKNNITNPQFDYEYMKVGGSLKNNVNEFDKFEISVTSSSEAIYIYSLYNSEYVLSSLSSKFYIEERLIDHYYYELTKNGNNMINPFQERLIFNLFYKYYGECCSIKNSNSRDYIRLMLIAREMLRYEKLFLLAEVASSKIISMSSRKDLNKKEKLLLESSEVYKNVMEKYNYDDRIITEVRSIIATTITSEFQIIDPDSDNYGDILTIVPDVIIYQILTYITLI